MRGTTRTHRRTRRVWALRLAAGLATAALVAAGCGDDDSSDVAGPSDPTTSAVATSTGTTAAPQRGGTLTMLHYSELRGFSPLLAGNGARASDTMQLHAVFGSLVYVDLATGEVKDHFASMSSKDGKVWTVKIRPNIRFTDGTPYDAEAVKFNWELVKDPNNRAINAASMRQVESLRVVDSLTLEATLTQPNGQFPRVVAAQVTYIASPKAFQEKGPQAFATSPVGAGPFMVKEWVRDGTLTLVRNPDYWDAPKPYLDEVVIRQVPDEEQRFNSLRTGAGQMAEITRPAIAKRAEDAGFSIDRYVPSGGLYLVFNTSRPPFDDVRVRRAIALGLNLKGRNETVDSGLGEVPETFMRKGTALHDERFVLTGSTYNPDEAQRLLNEVAAQRGGPVEVNALITDSRVLDMEYFQSQLAKLDNIEMKLNVIESSALQPQLRAGNFDLGIGGAIGDDPDLLFDHLHSGSSLNVAKYANPTMDAALEEGRRALTVDTRKKAYETVQRRLVDDVPMILWTRHFLSNAYDDEKVGGVKVTNVGFLWADLHLRQQ